MIHTDSQSKINLLSEDDMPLKRPQLDSLERISSGARIYGAMFTEIQKEQNPFELLSNYREGVEKTLEHQDERMCKIMHDLGDRTMWASRMRMCHTAMRVMTMNLAVWGKPEFSWEETSGAMGLLRAITEGADITLSVNEPASEPA